jgi:hypothetical protein
MNDEKYTQDELDFADKAMVDIGATVESILSADETYENRFGGSNYRPTTSVPANSHTAINNLGKQRGGATDAVDPAAYEANAREAGRQLAKQIPKAQYEKLVAEHQRFALADLTGTISTSERRNWQLVKWQIEQIEDAMHGEDIDRLERLGECANP